MNESVPNGTGDSVHRAEKFAADDKVHSERCQSRNKSPYAVSVQDVATQGIQSYSCEAKSSHEMENVCSNSWSRPKSRKSFLLMIRLEFGKSCEDLSSNHRTSTQHRSEKNGSEERAVRRIKEGTSAVLLQSCLDGTWWADSMEWNWTIRPLKGRIMQFGAMIEHHPISVKGQSTRLHQFE